MPEKQQMTKGDSSRIQSSEAKSGNDPGFAARAQAAGDKNANAGNQGGQNNSGGNKK
ncbi:hypothetical protein CLAFUW4_13460 [Fulvia fulva]|uniref:SMP domain-containing protein n=1 Tax=Passalora fulva TaxID=5499 RepID=A0A9Q8PJP8_PASFU|nr:uncharacterized protein CLAFUR5_13313 [Fulvia fulva]KAK4611790.1 hypothetical protein CLAFUR4_13463 [Fulvia fulva]KAK4612909.1 hypothetical protein CLAFUR0_13471 [Fulvia fulva]UJO23781.1 hypothetical protein CLAFUR5_13313 [Fulvia fulva]WPV20818.1 hypothetical protein CLAFUW4_13460 [Fulvia fulva]WPV36606.1 hypothetical protein CLAFUW7_13467 [Fulvia fulva]